ncbi:hypothetical protein KP806_19535 [Paenibacillus sp. N4]|nr:hypothetical protein [Paenibacillus vietnamensis]MCA0757258.1 hypothetical protein [Paenibacillus vietnamensis]
MGDFYEKMAYDQLYRSNVDNDRMRRDVRNEKGGNSSSINPNVYGK